MAVVDFERHDLDFLRAEYAHQRLGFTNLEMVDWFEGIGLKCENVSRLVGDNLTAVLWVARYPTEPPEVDGTLSVGESNI